MRGLFIAVAVALLLGCQTTPDRPQTPLGSSTGQLKAEGDALAARGEYAAAVVKYQAAVNQEPTDVSLHYALGVALSELGRRQETIEAFRRVVELGQPDSEEVQVARRWLVRAGVLGESVPVASPSSGPTGTLKGKTQWTEGLPKSGMSLKIFLSGDDAATQGQNFRRSLVLGEPYVFENVPPGTYRITAEVKLISLWEQQVAVEADRETILDLSPANSLISPAELPGKISEAEGGKAG